MQEKKKNPTVFSCGTAWLDKQTSWDFRTQDDGDKARCLPGIVKCQFLVDG